MRSVTADNKITKSEQQRYFRAVETLMQSRDENVKGVQDVLRTALSSLSALSKQALTIASDNAALRAYAVSLASRVDKLQRSIKNSAR